MENAGSELSGAKVRLFWLTFGLATIVLAFGLLVTQTPGGDRTFDVVTLSAAGGLLLLALLLGRLRVRSGPWRAWPVAFTLMATEFLICVYGLVSVLTYRRW